MKILNCMLLWACAAMTLYGCGGRSASAGNPAEEEAAKVDPDSAVILDVRSGEEYASGHLRGARNIPHDRIAEEIAAVVPDKTAKIILYCRSGRRAGTALKTLNSMGYENALNLGGLEDAQERLGLPVVKE